MKAIFAVVALCLISAVPALQQPREDFGLPELHRIKTATLSPSYSCRSDEEFTKGYAETALFLSRYSRNRRSPELLFDGACKSEDHLEGALAGDQLDVIADLGEVPLEELRADQVFNTRRVARLEYYSSFSEIARPLLHHTYAVLINKGDIRGFFYFTVTGYVPNQKLELKYVVKDYELLNRRDSSAGFNWGATNHP
jgi:hypothetical protein